MRHVSGGGVPTAGSSAWRDRAIVGLGVRLTTRGRLICLDAAIRHASIVGPERAISHRRNERLSMFDNNGSFLLALFEFFLFFAWFMCLWWILGDIFRSRDIGGVAKTLWVLFVIVIPWLGILVYVIARGPISSTPRSRAGFCALGNGR